MDDTAANAIRGACDAAGSLLMYVTELAFGPCVQWHCCHRTEDEVPRLALQVRRQGRPQCQEHSANSVDDGAYYQV